MKAIETEYKGVLFRSRLEARWAILFDSLNIKWVYEPECFMLSNGLKYTPDFYIEKYNLYIEVKPNFEWLENEYHLERYKLFSNKLLLLSGSFPDFKTNLMIEEKEIINVIFCPNHKYQPLFFSGQKHGSYKDEFNADYEEELNQVKQYRFYK